jgi:hypothetical protein
LRVFADRHHTLCYRHWNQLYQQITQTRKPKEK